MPSTLAIISGKEGMLITPIKRLSKEQLSFSFSGISLLDFFAIIRNTSLNGAPNEQPSAIKILLKILISLKPIINSNNNPPGKATIKHFNPRNILFFIEMVILIPPLLHLFI